MTQIIIWGASGVNGVWVLRIPYWKVVKHHAHHELIYSRHLGLGKGVNKCCQNKMNILPSDSAK